MTDKAALRAEYQRRYLQRPEVKARRAARQRRVYATPEGKHAKLEAARRYKYGMLPGDYTSLLEAQGGICAICQSAMVLPHVDHCHQTGRVRGILCLRCNSGIGMFGDSPSTVRRAASYLEDVS